MVPAIAIAAIRHTNIVARTHFFPIAGGPFLKLLGAELRVADYAVDAWLTRDRYRKSQTNQPVRAGFEVMMRKQAGKSKSRINGPVSHVRAHMRVDDELHRAITKLIAVDAIAIASRRFWMRILTLLWLGDSSVADTDTV